MTLPIKSEDNQVPVRLLGIVTPFCSCSAVPLFIGFVTAGVPLGVTFSFLISAPMVNEIALVLLFGLFGWKIAALYLGTGLVIAMIAGWTIGKIGMERHAEPWVYETIGAAGESAIDERIPFADRIRQGLDAVRDIVGKVWIYVALGTVLAFMMSVIALSLPETIILRKVLRPRLIATFAGVVGTGIMIVGYLFNAVM